MSGIERTDCPNCARPMGFEYREVEPGKCQLWRVMNEGHGRIEPRTIADCFAHTSRRIKELKAALAETSERANAAQRALGRHHAAAQAKVEPFRDGARIE